MKHVGIGGFCSVIVDTTQLCALGGGGGTAVMYL